MIDKFGREINYLRISVTDRCNLRCKYCYNAAKEFKHEVISLDKIEKMSDLLEQFNGEL